MRLLCEIVGSEFLPVVRALISKNLIEKYGYTQTEVAEILGVSQPLISFYLNGLRARNFKNFIEKNKEIIAEIESLCRKITENEIDRERIFLEALEIAKRIYKKENIIIPCKK